MKIWKRKFYENGKREFQKVCSISFYNFSKNIEQPRFDILARFIPTRETSNRFSTRLLILQLAEGLVEKAQGERSTLFERNIADKVYGEWHAIRATWPAWIRRSNGFSKLAVSIGQERSGARGGRRGANGGETGSKVFGKSIETDREEREKHEDEEEGEDIAVRNPERTSRSAVPPYNFDLQRREESNMAADSFYAVNSEPCIFHFAWSFSISVRPTTVYSIVNVY